MVISRSKQDSAHFRPLYERYYPVIFRFILRRTGEKEITADLCSQVFMKALVNLSKYTPRGLPFSAWLYRIAANECNDFFRRAKRVRTVVIDEAIADSVFDEMFDEQFREEWLVRLPGLLQRLKPDELMLIELRFLEGRSFKEVATIVGITENHAKVRVYRVLDKLRRHADTQKKLLG